MNKLKKQLKVQAKEILPDEDFKQSLKSQVLPSYDYQKEYEQKKKSKTVLIKSLASVASVVVVIVALVLGITLTYNPNVGKTNGQTVVLIDINPSFEIIADENDVVEKVTGLNSDARIVLLGKNYAGKNLYDVCNDIVITAIHLNYVGAVSDIVNIIAYNQNSKNESLTINKITSLIEESVGGSAQVVVSNSNEAKQKLINDIVAQYGDINGLSDKTIAELHRILMAYDISKEEELDELEDLWEEELEKAGFDDDIAEDILDKWKEENLKPLGSCLDEELEDYLEIFELKLIYNQNISEKEAERLTKEEHRRIMSMGGRNNVREFLDAWWIEAEKEYFDLMSKMLEDKGYDNEKIQEIIDEIKIDFQNNPKDKKEEIAEFLEEYYEIDD